MKTLLFFAAFSVALLSCNSADVPTEKQAVATPAPTPEVNQDEPEAEETDLLVVDEYDIGSISYDYRMLHFMVRKIASQPLAHVVIEHGKNGVEMPYTKAKEICENIAKIEAEQKKPIPEGATRRIKYSLDRYFHITFEKSWYIGLNGETVFRIPDCNPFVDKLQAAIAKAESL